MRNHRSFIHTWALRLGCTAAVAVLALSSAACTKDGITKDFSNASAETAATTSSAATTTTTASAAATTTTVPAIPEGTPSVGWCNATSMHIRSGPGTDYGAIGGLVTGEKVDILGREGDWYKIKFKDGVGYVSAQFISSTVVTTTMAPAATTTAPTTAAAQ